MNDPGKENMIRIERHLTSDLRPATRNLRNMIERSKTLRRFLSFVAIFGVSLIIADGIITPSQSILGAIQGQLLFSHVRLQRSLTGSRA